MIDAATHERPAWMSRSNFIIRIELSAWNMPGKAEQLWAFRLDQTSFLICCIPFFAYGISLGHEVVCDDFFTVKQVRRKGGHETVRIAVIPEDRIAELSSRLQEFVNRHSLAHEWFKPGYLAIDFPEGVRARTEWNQVSEMEAAELISVEVILASDTL